MPLHLNVELGIDLGRVTVEHYAEMASSSAKLIGIYNLDENNCEILDNLTKFLTAECRITYYEKLERYDHLSHGAAVLKLRKEGKGDERSLPFSHRILNEDLDLLTYEDLTALLYDDDEGITPRPLYEVVMILGHSNIYHVGPFDTSDVIETISTKHKPYIIALLGCCGGGTRYGPLLRISQMGSNTIFGFYQRRIYPNELVNTTLVLGIRNYFHLNHFHGRQVSTRVIIRRSLACAALDIPLDRDDPSIFANDSDEPSSAQNLFKIFNKKFTAYRNPIPLACSQLALFHVFTDPRSSPPINTFITRIEQEADTSKIEEECRRELEKRQLDQIISLTAKVLLLPVLEDTLDKLKDGRWKNVDPLQFMIATLHGYWGKNSYTIMRCCAQFHHNKLVEEATATVSEEDVHRYHLGSIALCLFCESTYVNFNLLDKKLAFHIVSDLDSQLQQLDSQSIPFECIVPIHIKLQQKELIWESEHYDAMKRAREEKDDRFIKLSEGNLTSESISNYRNGGKTFTYTDVHLKNALKALQTSLIQGTTNDTPPYHIKKFDNKCSESEGRMKCFIPWQLNHGMYTLTLYEYAEMRIIDIDAPPISRCRFVYQYCISHNTKRKHCVGILYFTDSHYGWDLIAEEDIDKTLKARRKVTEDELKELSYFKKQERLSKTELYQLQDKIKGTFPFKPIGILRIWEDKYTLM